MCSATRLPVVRATLYFRGVLSESSETRVSISEWLCLLAFSLLFIAIRLPLYTEPGIGLGWNSDAAIFGLMARAMVDGTDFPVFFWGQSYLGTLTSIWTAAIGWFSDVGLLALRIAVSMEVAIAALFFWAALRRIVGRTAAMLALLWLAAGPSFLFHFTIAPIGAEQLFFASALLFWYVTRSPLERASQWFVIGLISGLGLWLHQGIAFLGLAIGVALLIERAVRLRRIAAFAGGTAIGYLPAALSLLRNDPSLYKREIVPWSLVRVFGNAIEAIRGDVWLLLADASATGIVAGAMLLFFAIVGLRRQPWTRARIVMIGTIAVSAAFWIFGTYAYPGAVRYIVPLVPIVYGAAAAGIMRWWRAPATRIVSIVAIGVITLSLYVPRMQQSRDVAAGRTEHYSDWPGQFDPRPTLATIRRDGYRVCYAEMWSAHKLEWLSKPTVRFVPVRLVQRTLPQSLLLIQEQGPKCYVENDGSVRRLSASEEASLNATVLLRARKAHLLPQSAHDATGSGSIISTP